MELFRLDEFRNRIDIVDSYRSLIWTERWNAPGEWKLVIESTPANRARFIQDSIWVLNDSYHPMILQTIEDTVDVEGRPMLTITGRSLLQLLDQRVLIGIESVGVVAQKMHFENTPAAILREIFNMVCVLGWVDVHDGDFLGAGSTLPLGDIPEYPGVIVKDYEPASLLTIFTEMAQAYDFGCRVVCVEPSNEFKFDIYTGFDRTSGQTNNPAVIFSPNLDNLQNTSELKSTAIEKNVAYVYAEQGYAFVYAPGIPQWQQGFARKVMVVHVTDEPKDNPTARQAYLEQKGREALAVNRAYSAFDGEIVKNSQYRYGIDYYLGDLVEMQNEDGHQKKMRVTEQIFISDAEGERTYPTLSESPLS